MTKKTRNVLLLLLAIFSVPVFLVLGIVVFLALRPLPRLVPLPNPNAYDDLVKAGGGVALGTRNYAKLNVYQLRPLVQSNLTALAQARDALDSPCRVPLQFSQEDQQRSAGDLNKLWSLAQAFAAEGKLAGLDRRVGKQGECDLDLIRLGADAARGGMINDILSGNSIESLGATDLAKLAGQLDARTCREAAATLERLDAEKPSWPEAWKQEDNWVRRTFGAKAVVVEVVIHFQLKRIGPRLQRNYQSEQLKLRRLELDLALRAYELDKGHHPASSADVTPEYLKAVPKNPVTGKPLN